MVRTVGTTARGIRTPIVKDGDDIVEIVVDSILKAEKYEGFELQDNDIVGITESLIARAQGNYASIEQVMEDINNKFDDEVGIVFPILSRNRFSMVLKSIAMTGKKVYLLLNYPNDEVGNPLMDENLLAEKNINPYTDLLSEKDYRDIFGYPVKHPFTNIDYIELYKSLAKDDNIEIYLSNNPLDILNFTKDVLVANVHDRKMTKAILKNANANKVIGLDEILNEPIGDSGYNPQYGLLGSNLATEDSLKLFPRDSQKYVEKIHKEFKKRTGKNIEVMVYGDGAFKDPVGKIWELADPVVSPGYTEGLSGKPNEIKLKYLADTDLADLDSEEAEEILKERISHKSEDSSEKEESLGTTPRNITDLLGSLCDLTSGSGDKGTPVVLIQGYFDNFASK